MVKLNRTWMLLAMGNTYANLEELRALGFIWNSSHRSWSVKIEGHPMNNTKQLKKLEARLTALEERGVRFVHYATGERSA